MKTEYLNRAVTISRDSLHELGLSMAKEKIGAADSLEGVAESIRFAAAMAIGEDALSAELFTDDNATTIRGEDYAVKAYTALRNAAAGADDFAEKHDSDAVVSAAVLGELTTVFFEVEDKLFGSDHVEEHESAKEESKDE